MIRIIVCMKQVLDPEAPVSAFQVDPEAKRAIPPKGTPPVLSPYDENALEAALRIKAAKDAEITVISMGPHLAKPVVKKSLAVGADNLIMLEDEAFEDLDSYCTAYTLASTVKKIGSYDLILCGRQASDTDAGQVGSGIAEILGIPSITIARKIEVSTGRVRVERVVLDGYEVVEAPIPALITVGSDIGELRSPTITAIIAAQKKSAVVWNSQDVEVVPSQLKRTNLLKLFIPVHEGRCQIIEGESPEEAGENLALKIREAGII
ncbi:electron transfer flavoprotein subunit beta/FixA family protein [Chloroflexota bacterium]